MTIVATPNKIGKSWKEKKKEEEDRSHRLGGV